MTSLSLRSSLASRYSGVTTVNTDINSLLLETLNARANGGALPTTQDLLAKLAETNPTAGLIAQLLAQNQQQEREREASSEEEGGAESLEQEPDQDRMRSREKSRAAHRLRQKIGSMNRELSELRERNDALAAALGACHLCWGSDPECEICAGRGSPGASEPDKRLFAQFVRPAVRTLQKSGDNTFSKATDPPLSKGKSTSHHQRRDP